MNYRGFKKVHEDDEKAILKNQRGHEITLAKKQLSKGHCDALSKLPLYAAEGAGPVGDKSQILDTLRSQAGVDPTISNPENEDEPQQEAPSLLGTLRDQSAPVQEAIKPIAKQAPQERGVASSPDQVNTEPELSPGQEHMKEAALWANDLQNGHIKPETYSGLFAKKDFLGKMGSLFGIMLSGVGSGLSGQPNAVMEMMNKEIDRDLDAQKQSKSNAMNYYKANLERMKTLAGLGLTEQEIKLRAIEAAKAQTQLALTQHFSHLLMGQTPETAAKGQALLGNVIAPAVSNDIQQTAAQQDQREAAFKQQNEVLRNAEMAGVLPGGSAKAASNEAHHYPGISGVSSAPISEGDRNYLDTGINFDKQLNNFIQWTKSHSGSLDPKDIITGRAKAAELSGAYRQATNGGVYKEGEQNFISKLIDEDPTKFFNEIRVLPSLLAISEGNKSRINNRLSARGLGHYGTVWSGGVEYTKGPDGKAVPVKK